MFAESHEACNLYDYCYSLIQVKVFMQSHPFVVLGEKVSATCSPNAVLSGIAKGDMANMSGEFFESIIEMNRSLWNDMEFVVFFFCTVQLYSAMVLVFLTYLSCIIVCHTYSLKSLRHYY